MIGDLFDSPWKVLILAVVILVLFGSRKLPDAARSLGKSMRILKTEIHELHDEEPAASTVTTAQTTPVPQAPPQITQQQQVEELQQQLDELRKQSSTAEAQQTQAS
ncbi:MAG TPA: Sec-independent protein translocase subunit TatA [Streptosporangiaceae bacterium]|jgi:sec-independent protein translocase protein TatA